MFFFLLIKASIPINAPIQILFTASKSDLHVGIEWLKVVQQTMSNSCDKDLFGRITKSDIEDAKPEGFDLRINCTFFDSVKLLALK